MVLFRQMTLVVLLLASLSLRAQETSSSSSDLSGQKIFAKVLPFVFKVKTSPSADSPQASYGTGFVVEKSGLLVTNYHVISGFVTEPKKNKIFVMVADVPVSAQVLAVDVVHDLALIRIDKSFPSALKFASRSLKQGEPIYSIGQPEDLNMSIVSGTYNSEVAFGQYEIIHLSAPINSGMSGGPTVNQNAEIIGVNVSKLVDASNVSFAVPGRFAQGIFQTNKDLKDHPDLFWKDIEKQLTELQTSLTKEILETTKKTKKFYKWQTPDLPKNLKCWSVPDRNSEEDKEKYDTFGEICGLMHTAHLNSEIRTGTYRFSQEILEAKKINAWQFYRLISSSATKVAFRNGGVWNSDDKPKLRTKGDCFSDILVNSTGLAFKVSYCARSYTHFPDLQDAHIYMSTLSAPPQAFSADIELDGFTKENIKLITRQYIDSVSKENL
ncbi:putative serine protease HhoA precursor [compost metagenome]